MKKVYAIEKTKYVGRGYGITSKEKTIGYYGYKSKESAEKYIEELKTLKHNQGCDFKVITLVLKD